MTGDSFISALDIKKQIGCKYVNKVRRFPTIYK